MTNGTAYTFTVTASNAIGLPKGAEWAPALRELARQVEVGKVYDRDLPALAEGIDAVIAALSRRPGLRRLR